MSAITTDLPALAQSIKDWGRELGFQQVGISGLDLAEHEQHLQRWLEAGYHGDKEQARMLIHGMPSAEWKATKQSPATAEQLARMEASMAKNAQE